MLELVANKERLLTVRLSPDVHEDYRVAARLRGNTMSGLVHMFIVRTIREEKTQSPSEFNRSHAETARPVITARIRKSTAKAKRKK